MDEIEVKASGLVKDALNAAGIETCKFPPRKCKKNCFYAYVGIGGCWACAVLVDRRYALSCLTPFMKICKSEF